MDDNKKCRWKNTRTTTTTDKDTHSFFKQKTIMKK